MCIYIYTPCIYIYIYLFFIYLYLYIDLSLSKYFFFFLICFFSYLYMLSSVRFSRPAYLESIDILSTLYKNKTSTYQRDPLNYTYFFLSSFSLPLSLSLLLLHLLTVYIHAALTFDSHTTNYRYFCTLEDCGTNVQLEKWRRENNRGEWWDARVFRKH